MKLKKWSNFLFAEAVVLAAFSTILVCIEIHYLFFGLSEGERLVFFGDLVLQWSRMLDYFWRS